MFAHDLHEILLGVVLDVVVHLPVDDNQGNPGDVRLYLPRLQASLQEVAGSLLGHTLLNQGPLDSRAFNALLSGQVRLVALRHACDDLDDLQLLLDYVHDASLDHVAHAFVRAVLAGKVGYRGADVVDVGLAERQNGEVHEVAQLLKCG